jgi:hypothetical protein
VVLEVEEMMDQHTPAQREILQVLVAVAVAETTKVAAETAVLGQKEL